MSAFKICICAVLICIGFVELTTAGCTCKNPEWCKPISSPMPKKEVFIFITSNQNWKLYDWSKVTTVSSFTTIDPDLVCFAHSKGVRVVYGADFPGANLTNEADRHAWVGQQIDKITTNNLDGVNVDFEEGIPLSDQGKRDGLSLLMMELYSKLKVMSPNYQVTFDIAWIPNIDQRFYNYTEIVTNYTDFGLVMSYDERSQIHGDCIAWANSAINNTQSGIQEFIKKGIPASKLVLGVPWYGYDYPCTKIVGDTCHIKEVPFRGVPCSDAAGRQRGYSSIGEQFLPKAIGGIKWDMAAQSPYFNYKDNSTGQMHQIWFDNPKSLTYKYSYASTTDMRGVGMWTADSIDYGNSTQAKQQREAMWGALPKKLIY